MANELVMMLENGIATVAPNSEFVNEKLQQYTARIFDLTQATKRNLFEIAVLLATIENEKLYETAGYKTVQEYAEKNFGYKSSMVYKMLHVAQKFIEPNNEGKYASKLAHDERDYSVSQLMELDQVEFETAKSLDETGTIQPTMTTKEIREVVKDFRNGEIDATGQPIKPREETDNDVENDINEGENSDVDVADELNGIIEHCERLMSSGEVSSNKQVAKKIKVFKEFCMRYCMQIRNENEE